MADISRRLFLGGLLAAATAPAIVRSGVLMPVRPAIILPPEPGFQDITVALEDYGRNTSFTQISRRSIEAMQREMLRRAMPSLMLARFGAPLELPAPGSDIMIVRRRLPFAA